MKLLAFDTSTHWLTVACGDGETWHTHGELAGQAHSERLLPVIEAMLAQAGWTLHDLDGIAFGAGPGSFTGVRIACGVAQGLGLGADVPLVPVSTLEALAQQSFQAHGVTRVVACLDARMREVYIGLFERGNAGWREDRAPVVKKAADAQLPPATTPWFGAGDGFAVYPDLALRWGLTAIDAGVTPDARAIGELAMPRFAHGEGVDAADAYPLYVRHRVALTTAEREAGARL